MKASSLVATAVLTIFSSCTTEDSLPKRPDTSGMSREAAKLWEDGVQFGPVSPQSQAHATEASKAFEYGIPPAELPPARSKTTGEELGLRPPQLPLSR